MGDHDHRRPAWAPGKTRCQIFEMLSRWAKAGLTIAQIANRCGCKRSGIKSYLDRQGLSMQELRDADLS